MIPPKILVTGATGNTGRALVDELLARGLPVRAMVRRRDERSDALARRGAEVVVADLFDPEQLHAAIRGTQRAYYVPPTHPYMIQSAAAFAAAARGSGLEAIVQMSQWLSHRAHPALMTRQTWLADRLLADLPGVAHVIFNPGMFADNFLRVIDFAALLGVYPILTGDGRAAPVSNEDMARTAAALLLDPARHAGRSYRPTGPRLLSGREMAAEIARALGHRVIPVDLPFWVFRKVARQQRVDPFQVAIYQHYVEEIKRGTFALDGGVTSVVEDLTGTPAESFEATARRYAARPFARKTLGNRLKAFVKFNLTPFYPGYDLTRLARVQGWPASPAPSWSIDDASWRDAHARQMAAQGPAAAGRETGERLPVLGALSGN